MVAELSYLRHYSILFLLMITFSRNMFIIYYINIWIFHYHII